MSRLIVPASVSAVLFLLIAATASAATLKVGPNQQFARPSQAIQAAQDGDTIEIDAGSPCIGKGVAAGKFGDFDLTPTEQYVHPCQREPRAAAGPLDVGVRRLPIRRGGQAKVTETTEKRGKDGK